MFKLDALRLIRQTHELIDDSRNLCAQSRRIIEQSKRLKKLRRMAPPTFDRIARKRVLAK